MVGGSNGLYEGKLHQRDQPEQKPRRQPPKSVSRLIYGVGAAVQAPVTFKGEYIHMWVVVKIIVPFWVP